MKTQKFIDPNGDEWIVNHNTDFSGSMILKVPDRYLKEHPIMFGNADVETEISIPAELIKMIADSKVAHDLIGYLENHYL